MRLLLRISAIALIAFAAFHAFTAAAGAITISPTGSYTATASAPSFTLSSTGAALACQAASIPATFAANGAGTSTAGSSTFANCTNALLGTATITQDTVWHVSFNLKRLTLGGVSQPAIEIVFDVGAAGVRIEFRGGCEIRLSGSGTHLQLGPHALPFTQGPFDSYRTTSSALTVASVSGLLCSLGGIRVGLAVTYNMTLVLNRNVTISG